MVNVTLLAQAARLSIISWFGVFGRILTKAGEIVTPRPNYLQKQMSEIVKWCIDNQVPCRMIVLKPRQKGCSTFSTAILNWWCRMFVASACIIGGEYSQVQNLWHMMRRYIQADKMPWTNNADVKDTEITYSHGSKIIKETAKDSDAGRSGTIQALICTEAARWKEGIAVSAKAVLSGILNCVPNLPNTLVILESTANGMEGAFYEKWEGAVTLEEFKAGIRGNGYIKVFAAWFEFTTPGEDLDVLDHAAENIIRNTLTAEEADEMERHNLTLGQISWRRRMIKSDCGGDPEIFKQEFPSDPVTAFLASGRMAFDPKALSVVEQEGRKMQVAHGVLERPTNSMSVVWRPTPTLESWLQVWEAPQYGRKYLIAADPSTGADQAGGDDPDRHSVLVIRAGQFVQGRGWVPPAIVARIRPPCFVAIDVLADLIDRISWFYGRCIVVPEINNSGLALVVALQMYNTPLYHRDQVINLRSSSSSASRKVIGWQTTGGGGGTRRLVIEILARAIREFGADGEGVVIPCAHVMGELRKMIVPANGVPTAATGAHDDDVLALAIGLASMQAATIYNEQVLLRPVPRDLRGVDEEGRGGAGNSQYT